MNDKELIEVVLAWYAADHRMNVAESPIDVLESIAAEARADKALCAAVEKYMERGAHVE